jgi:hypothetical protein
MAVESRVLRMLRHPNIIRGRSVGRPAFLHAASSHARCLRSLYGLTLHGGAWEGSVCLPGCRTGYGDFEDEDYLYLVEEYADGVSIQRFIAARLQVRVAAAPSRGRCLHDKALGSTRARASKAPVPSATGPMPCSRCGAAAALTGRPAGCHRDRRAEQRSGTGTLRGCEGCASCASKACKAERRAGQWPPARSSADVGSAGADGGGRAEPPPPLRAPVLSEAEAVHLVVAPLLRVRGSSREARRGPNGRPLARTRFQGAARWCAEERSVCAARTPRAVLACA